MFFFCFQLTHPDIYFLPLHVVKQHFDGKKCLHHHLPFDWTHCHNCCLSLMKTPRMQVSLHPEFLICFVVRYDQLCISESIYKEL